ncbi:hypothetical protein MKX03_010176 [Papaver bracteatum]|nr:hypothetical protein MKX03_010176 [Papaver bracteatum]
MASTEIMKDGDHDHQNNKDDVPAATPSPGGNEICGDADVTRDKFSCVSSSHGSISVCGRRREMEDAITVIPGLLPSSNRNPPCDHDLDINEDDKDEESKYDFFAVYDGHGGSGVANLCSEQLHKVLVNEIQGSSNLVEIHWENVMVSCFLKMDEQVVSGKEVEDENIKSTGSTAVVSLISKDKIIVANCGDSRAVLSRAGSPIPLSQDHKPDATAERERIEAAGGTVVNWNGSRVLGVLATSRSIGDRYLKPYVISVPEVTVTSRTESDEFVILASDGLWDVMSNKMACNIARRCLQGRVAKGSSSRVSSSPSYHTGNAARAAAFLTEVSMAKGSKDNISVVIVELKKLI